MSEDARGRARRARGAGSPPAPVAPQYARGVPHQPHQAQPAPQSTQPPLGSAPAVRMRPGTPVPQGAGAPVGQRARQRPQPSGRPVRPPKPTRPPARTAADTRLAGALARSRAWARPSGVGARLAAYSIDAFVCLAIATGVGIVTRSVLIGVIVVIELAVILLVIEARTGATVGNLLLRQRTARDDAPFSPGVGRALVRGLVQGAGSLIALIGGWGVVATSAADPARMGRSWADRAGRTLVVKVPTPAERQAWSNSAAAWAHQAPVEAVPTNTGAAAPVSGALSTTPAPPARVSAPVAPTGAVRGVGGAPQVGHQPTTAPRVAAAPVDASASQTPAPALPPGVVTVDAPIAAAPPPREIGALLLLTFDTGQRAQLRIPAEANLGRRPDATSAEDQLVAVDDPAGSVSKTHLRLEYRGDSVWVTDLGSTNGSQMIDDTGASSPLAPGARTRLDDGASVRIGERSFTVATITGEL